jgi:hypothetical protein
VPCVFREKCELPLRATGNLRAPKGGICTSKAVAQMGVSSAAARVAVGVEEAAGGIAGRRLGRVFRGVDEREQAAGQVRYVPGEPGALGGVNHLAAGGPQSVAFGLPLAEL